jgi:hypothetical protein
MTEPVIQVTDKDVLAMLGSAYVEMNILRAQLAQAQAQIVKLTPKPKKPKAPA